MRHPETLSDITKLHYASRNFFSTVFFYLEVHKKPAKETKLCYPFSFIAPQQFEDLDEIVINNTQLGFSTF